MNMALPLLLLTAVRSPTIAARSRQICQCSERHHSCTCGCQVPAASPHLHNRRARPLAVHVRCDGIVQVRSAAHTVSGRGR